MMGALDESTSYDGGDQGFLNEDFDWYALAPDIDPHFAEAERRGYFLEDTAGRSRTFTVFMDRVAQIDLTNPDARAIAGFAGRALARSSALAHRHTQSRCTLRTSFVSSVRADPRTRSPAIAAPGTGAVARQCVVDV